AFANPNAASNHNVYTDYSFPFTFNTRHYAWIGDADSGNLNTITDELSHEVVEAMTDPDGDGIQVLPRNNTDWNEIGDNEAAEYHALINGYIVQSYWSLQDGAFAVYDVKWTPLSRPKNGDPSLHSHQALRALIHPHAGAGASSPSNRPKVSII